MAENPTVLGSCLHGPVCPPSSPQELDYFWMKIPAPPRCSGSEPTPRPATGSPSYIAPPKPHQIQMLRQVTMSNDPVNRPQHYRSGSLETVQAIEGLGLGYFEGNVLKYLSRYRHKGKPVEDLRKAQWYLERLIEREERG